MNEVTIFKNAQDVANPHYIQLSTALQRIKEGASKEAVEIIRQKFKDGEEYSKEKRSLPSVVYGGRADKLSKGKEGQDTYRNDECITQHSGFFILDFDETPTDIIKARLKKDTYIYACWRGVTKGAKALVKCPPNTTRHSEYYNAFLSRYPELDTTSKNIGRLCFESYDPDLFINHGAVVWDRTMSDEEYQVYKEGQKGKRKKKILDISSSMIRNSTDGSKHEVLLKASRLVGGAVGVSLIGVKEAIDHLTAQIKKKSPKDLNLAIITIKAGIEYGKKAPLHEIKEIEKSTDFTKREDGSYDFLADDSEMDEYEYKLINGLLEMGLSTSIPKLDSHWMFKKHTLVWLAARDNVGKSFVFWYFSVLVAMLHGWKILMYAKENRDGSVRKKLKEFYIGKSIKTFTQEEQDSAKVFIDQHFKLFTAKRMHTAGDFLMKCEIVYDEGFEYSVVVADPYNSFEVLQGENQYSLDKRVLNQLQTFKENYSSVWVTDHITSAAAREKGDGEMTVPTKHSTDGGQNKANKADDFLIAHRNPKDPATKMTTELHVDKIKDVETGGLHTPKEEPVLLIANYDLCGFSCEGVDPVKEYWRRVKPDVFVEPKSIISTQGWSKPEPEDDGEAPF